jgi:hypothetical protein
MHGLLAEGHWANETARTKISEINILAGFATAFQSKKQVKVPNSEDQRQQSKANADTSPKRSHG